MLVVHRALLIEGIWKPAQTAIGQWECISSLILETMQLRKSRLHGGCMRTKDRWSREGHFLPLQAQQAQASSLAYAFSAGFQARQPLPSWGTCQLAAIRESRPALHAHCPGGGGTTGTGQAPQAALSFTANHAVATKAKPKLFPKSAGF